MTSADMNYAWLEALPDGAVILDEAGQVIAVNHAAIDILQADPKGLLATSFLRAPALSSAIRQVREQRHSTSVDLEFHGRLQRQVCALLSCLGSNDHILIILRDLTREQAVEKMRSDFVANASHEMRTPLSTIIGTIETLQGAAKDDPKAREMFLNSMLGQAQRMKRLIDDLLTLSRIELNAHVRPNTKVSLVSIIKQAKANLSSFAAEFNVKLELKADGDVDVSGEADELLQVALNLIENAIKYGGEGKRVEITCAAAGKIAVLSITDFGQGIAEEHIPRLTERFYRVSTKQSRARGGTGLGLAIVKHIVLRHRGELNITSTSGQGSRFSVSIPLYNSIS
jgi:two-component system, OmpR family, phosphate regulon sensor histidine kinase PhoR